MIDILLRAYLIEKRPIYGVFLGFFFATLGLVFASLIFSKEPSFPAIFLTTMAAAPVIIKVIRNEEWRPAIMKIMDRHRNVIKTYSYMFYGMAIAFALWYAVLPDNVTFVLFKEQLAKFIPGRIPGVGIATTSTTYFDIVVNNIGLVFFFFLLSLFYGSGSVFLLAWNASILGIVWGNALKAATSLITPQVFVANTLFSLPFVIPETWAYFLASVAGGIVSVNINQPERRVVAVMDSLIFLGVSLVAIIVAGGIEVLVLGIK